MKNYVKSKPRILETLLKNFISIIIFLFLSFLLFNLYLAHKKHTYDKVTNFVHDYADVSMYASNLAFRLSVEDLSTEKRQGLLSSQSELFKDIRKRMSSRKEIFLEIYSEDEVKVFEKNLEIVLNPTDHSQEYIQAIEDAYINLLVFSKKHSERSDGEFIKSIILVVVFLLINISLLTYYTFRKLHELVYPLIRITEDAEKLSITDGNMKITLVENYYEYYKLSISLKEMLQRIQYENKVTASSAASNSVGHLVESIAHAVNNPLATIATSLKILQKKYKKTNEHEDLVTELDMCMGQINQITEITLKMKSLINTSTKSISEDFDTENIGNFIKMLYLNRFIERDIKFNLIKECDLIHGKEEVIINVLVNLVDFILSENKDKSGFVIDLKFEKTNEQYILKLHNSGGDFNEHYIYSLLLGNGEKGSFDLYSSKKLAEDHGYNLHYNLDPKSEFILVI
jgi:K+-sensing histidine kinase KdpD